MHYVASHAISVATPRRALDLGGFTHDNVHAVAGIGNPDQFFSMLRDRGLRVLPHPFPDHHLFKPSDLDFDDDLPVLMTEKDAVKCEPFAAADWWSVPVTAEMPEIFATRIKALLARGHDGQATA
jgi:tetraacyldisaccharide 4'-kinase